MRVVMEAAQVDATLGDLAAAIQFRQLRQPRLVGIQRRGLPLAQRLAQKCGMSSQQSVGSLDINFYRDDMSKVGPQPELGVSNLPWNLDDQEVILVDDVLFSGRTVRAALEALLAYGRPRVIYLAVLIDRGHRELPIEAQWVGQSIKTAPADHIEVLVQELDGRDAVIWHQAGSHD